MTKCVVVPKQTPGTEKDISKTEENLRKQNKNQPRVLNNVSIFVH